MCPTFRSYPPTTHRNPSPEQPPTSTLQRRSQQFARGVVEGDQANMLNLCRRCSDGRDCDLRCLVARESVYAGGDGGEGDAASANLIGNRKAAPIARRQDVSLAVAAAFPDRADGVNDMTYWWRQVKSWRGNRIARITRSQRCPRLGQTRPRRTVNRPIDTAATQQRLVRRGHDGVDVLAGDVATNNFDHRHGSMMPPAGQLHLSSRADGAAGSGGQIRAAARARNASAGNVVESPSLSTWIATSSAPAW